MLSVTDQTAPVNFTRAMTFTGWARARGVDLFQLGERDDFDSLERLYELEDQWEDECRARRAEALDAATAASDREQAEHRAWCEKEGAQLIAAKRWNVALGDRILLTDGDWVHVPTAVVGAKPKFDKEAARAALKLNIGSAEEVAKLIIKNKLTRADGIRAVCDEGRIWLPNSRGIWAEVPEHEIAQWTAEYDGVTYDFTDKGRAIWLKIGAGFTSSTLKQIQKEIASPGFFAAVPAGVAFQNGWVSLPSRTFEAGINVAHRVRAVLPYDYDPSPPAAVEWRRYLESIWRDDAGELDREAVNLVHQILGYLIAGRHDQEKVFALLGPTRAGKGVLLKLIQEIFGEQATSFKLVNLGGPFAMQSLLGKSVAYDPDARRSSANETKATERLLSTSSHEFQQVERKNQTSLSVALPSRLLIAANPPFGLSDLGGAVAGRIMVLTFPRSFFGKEDRGMLDRLRREIPAIVALALAALDDLDAVGHFVEPVSSAGARKTLERAQNPMAGFLDDWCIVDATSPVEARPMIDAGVLYTEMKAWCGENGHTPPSNQKFSEILAQRGITQHRPNANGRARIYVGVKLNQ